MRHRRQNLPPPEIALRCAWGALEQVYNGSRVPPAMCRGFTPPVAVQAPDWSSRPGHVPARMLSVRARSPKYLDGGWSRTSESRVNHSRPPGVCIPGAKPPPHHPSGRAGVKPCLPAGLEPAQCGRIKPPPYQLGDGKRRMEPRAGIEPATFPIQAGRSAN